MYIWFFYFFPTFFFGVEGGLISGTARARARASKGSTKGVILAYWLLDLFFFVVGEKASGKILVLTIKGFLGLGHQKMSPRHRETVQVIPRSFLFIFFWVWRDDGKEEGGRGVLKAPCTPDGE